MQTKIRRVADKLSYHESQGIVFVKDSGTHSFPDNTLEILSRSTAQQLEKKCTSQVDPFLIEKDDKLYVFYEALSFRNSKGTLRRRVLDHESVEFENTRLEDSNDLKCHLLFPYLVYINDQLFMVLEPLEKREVILFQSIESPARWKRVKVLISDIKLTDNVFISISETCYPLSTTMGNEIITHSADHIYGQQQWIIPSLKVSNPHY